MLAASTSQNQVAAVLDGYAQTFAAPFDNLTHIAPPRSTGSAIARGLDSQPGEPFFFFGHGLSDPASGFAGHDNEPAVDTNSLSLLVRRTVCATCCHGDRVGAFAGSYGFSLVGYAGILWVPHAEPHITDMEPAALTAPREIVAGSAPSEAADKSSKAYSALVRILYNRNQPGDRLASLFVSLNAGAAASW
jgi:hypothetical protein